MNAYVERIDEMWELTDSIETEPEQHLKLSGVRPSLFDYLLGGFIVAMFATNYSPYNDLVSTVGMAMPVLLLVSFSYTRYHLQREFIAFGILILWILLGAVLSQFRELSLLSAFFVVKIQFVAIVVALRCSSFRRMRFYLAIAGIGTAFLVVPAMFSAKYMAYDARLAGGPGDPNALGAISVCSFVAWMSLLFLNKGRLRWILCPVMAAVSLYVMILTASRGAFFAILFSLALGSWYVWRRGNLRTKMLLSVALLVMAILGFVATRHLLVTERVARLLVALGFNIKSVSSLGGTSGRVDIAKMAIEIFYQYPIMGAGWGTFPAYTGRTYSHTTLFDLLYATGVVGTFLYYFVVFSAWFVLRKAKKLAANNPEIVLGVNICQVVIVTQLVAGLSLPTEQSKFQAVLTGIWLGIAWHVRTWIKEQKEQLSYLPESQSIAETA
jgi:hypothetical protein